MSDNTTWQSRKDWRNGKIRPQYTRLPFYISLTFFSIWTLIAVPVNLENQGRIEGAIQRFLDSGYQYFDPVMLLPLMLLLSVIMLPSLVKTWRRAKRSKNIFLRMEPYPAYVGKTMSGNVSTPIQFKSGMQVDVHINCIKVTASRQSGSSSNRWETVEWRGKAQAQVIHGAFGSTVRFSANIPANLPPADIEKKGTYYFWAVRMQLPDESFDETFNIPVLVNSSSQVEQPDGQVNTFYIPDHESITGVENDIRQLPAEVAVFRETPDGFTIDYPPNREASIARVFIIMAVIFGLVAMFIAYQVVTELGSERVSYFSVMVMGMIFLGFTLFSIGMLFGEIYMLTNRLRVEHHKTGIKTTRQVFGREFIKEVSHDQVHHLEKKVTSQAGQGASAKINYTINLITNEGRKVSLGDGISGHENADSLYDYLERKIETSPTVMSSELLLKAKMPTWLPYLIWGAKFLATLAFLGTLLAFVIDFMHMK